MAFDSSGRIHLATGHQGYGGKHDEPLTYFVIGP